MNSKTTFAVTTAILLALVVGGGYAGFRIGTAEPAAQAGPSQQGPSEAAPAGTGNDAAGAPRSSDAAGTPAAGVTSAANSGGTPIAGPATSAEGSSAGSAGGSMNGGSMAAGAMSGAAGTSTGGSSGAGGSAGAGSVAGTSSGAASVEANGDHGGAGAGTSVAGANVDANGNSVRGSNANPAAVTGTKGTSAGDPAGVPRTANPQITTSNSAAAGSGDATKGAALFASKGCAGCHMANGHGGVGASLVEANGPKNWTLDQFTAVLREGKAPDRVLNSIMPRFANGTAPNQLTDSDIADLQAHIKTLN